MFETVMLLFVVYGVVGVLHVLVVGCVWWCCVGGVFCLCVLCVCVVVLIVVELLNVVSCVHFCCFFLCDDVDVVNCCLNMYWCLMLVGYMFDDLLYLCCVV